LVEKKNDPVLQGTNGILTVGFIVVLLLCSVGFLIYWILSIQSRALQFGIFRAMGMSMREVITMLINEQLFISGLSIAAGAVVGSLAAKLYMPLIQIAYAASDNALPLELISHSSDNVRLFAVIGAVMLVCMVILGGLISRMKIAQALKLGED
jgi:putative ABC transport system permease protein